MNNMIKKTSKIKFVFFIFTIIMLTGSIFTVTLRDTSEINSFNLKFNLSEENSQDFAITSYLNHHLFLHDEVSVFSPHALGQLSQGRPGMAGEQSRLRSGQRHLRPEWLEGFRTHRRCWEQNH